jgi:CRP-like cAMP-binding protein
MSIAEPCIPKTTAALRALPKCLWLEPPSNAFDVEILGHDPSARRVAQGEALFASGQAGQEMFVVTRGHIELRLPDSDAVLVQNTPYFALELIRTMARRLRRMAEANAGKHG